MIQKREYHRGVLYQKIKFLGFRVLSLYLCQLQTKQQIQVNFTYRSLKSQVLLYSKKLLVNLNPLITKVVTPLRSIQVVHLCQYTILCHSMLCYVMFCRSMPRRLCEDIVVYQSVLLCMVQQIQHTYALHSYLVLPVSEVWYGMVWYGEIRHAVTQYG